MKQNFSCPLSACGYRNYDPIAMPFLRMMIRFTENVQISLKVN